MSAFLFPFCIFLKGRKERKGEKKISSHAHAAVCGWFAISMAGVQTCTFIRLPNAFNNLGVGGFGPNRVKPFGLSSVALGPDALALVSFLQGERHTHTELNKAFLKLVEIFIHLKTDSELTTILFWFTTFYRLLVHKMLLFF